MSEGSTEAGHQRSQPRVMFQDSDEVITRNTADAVGPRPSFFRTFIQAERNYSMAMRQRYTLQKLKLSPVFNALAAWHTYGIWLTAAYTICLAGNVLLSWYVDWYKAVPIAQSGGRPAEDFPYGAFFMIFLRSFLLVHCAADFVRYSFILGREAWDADTFGGYRRAVLGLAYFEPPTQAEVGRVTEATQPGWPADLSKCRERLDTLFQFCIYVSFDLVPLGYAGYSSMQRTVDSVIPSMDMYAAGVALWESLLFVACCHTGLFYVAWTLNDIFEKFSSFKVARDGEVGRRRGCRCLRWPGRGRSRPAQPPAASVQVVVAEAQRQVEEALDNGRDCCGRFRKDSQKNAGACMRWLMRILCCRGWVREEQLLQAAGEADAAADAAQHLAQFRAEDGSFQPAISGTEELDTPLIPVDDLARRLNVCICLCGWITVFQWHVIFLLLFVALAVLAAYLQRMDVSIVCSVVAVALLVWRCRWPVNEPEVEGAQATPRARARRQRRQERRQAWGIRTCSLNRGHRSSQHKLIALVLLVQGALFYVAKQNGGAKICGYMLGTLLFREVFMYYEGDNSWWIGIIEGVVIWTTATFLQFYLKQGYMLGLATLGMVVLHQFGLRRTNDYFLRIQKLMLSFMFFQVLVLVALVVMTSSQPAEESTWSSFTPGAPNITIPWRDTFGLGMQCEMRFPIDGNSEMDFGRGLSLGDFSLFSALAYESADTMESALQHFFPGWKLKHSRIATGGSLDHSSRQKDWTTFFEFENDRGTASVIAVRGTDSTLDILSDINLWAPAAFLQAFELVGPWLSVGVSQAIAFWVWRPADQYFNELLGYVQKRHKSNPDRRWYMTGHSLGGGLAKLVGAQVGIEAVTFMAPGLERTLYLSLNQGGEGAAALIQTLLHQAVTVQPRNDLVSRVDSQVGVVIPVECAEDPLTCHKIYTGCLCDLFEKCGSMRAEYAAPLSLPCGNCGSMPC